MFSKSLQWILTAALAAILFATGYLIGLHQNKTELARAFTSGVARGAGALETLRDEEEGTAPAETEGETSLIVGQIAAISENQIQITSDSTQTPITVITTRETVFSIRNPKNAAQVSREQAAYQAAVNKNPQLSIAPPPTFTEEAAAADALHPGDFVEISTSSSADTDAILAVRVVRISPAPAPGQ